MNSRLWRLSLTARILFTFLCGGWVCLPSASGQDKQDEEVLTKTRMAILQRLRKACEDTRSLHGVLIKDGIPKDKALIIEGFLDEEKQRKILAKEAADLLTLKPWKDRFPDGINLDAMKISPLHASYLKRMKEEFAKGVELDTKDPKEQQALNRLLSQTRLDDLYYRYSPPASIQLVVSGVCIFSSEKEIETRESLKNIITRLLIEDYAPAELSDLFKDKNFKLDVSGIEIRNPLPDFQKKFTDADVDDIFFVDGKYSVDGTLQLQGWMGKTDPEGKRKLFTKHFASDSCVAWPEPRFSFDGMRAIDWPLDRKKWNAVLAQHPDNADVRRTHILRIYFDLSEGKGPRLRCDGVNFMNPKADQLDFLEKITGTLTTAWVKYFPETIRHCKDPKPKVELTDHWKIKEELQRALLHDHQAKKVLISKIFYDPEGMLVVEGMVDQSERKAVIEYLERSRWARWSAGRPSWDRLRTEDGAAKIKQFQFGLANHPERIFNEIRLDDIFLAYPDATGRLQIRFVGLTFHKDLNEEAEKVRTVLLKEAIKSPLLQEQVDDFKQISIEDLRSIPSGDKELQDQVKTMPTLDGVYLKPDPVFDHEGKLVLRGKWRGPKQADALKKMLEAHFKSKPLRPDAKGVVFQLEEVPTDQLLHDIRKWVAVQRVGSTYVDRLYFDSAGKLELEFRDGVPKSNKPRVEKELRRLIQLDRRYQKLELRKQSEDKPMEEEKKDDKKDEKKDDKKDEKKDDKKDEKKDDKDKDANALDLAVVFVAFLAQANGDEERLTVDQHLRRHVVLPKDLFWKGVLIEGGFFEADGTFKIVGIVDNEEQIERLKQVLDEMAEKPDWRAALEKRASLAELRKGLQIMPVQEMLDALHRWMPEFKEFDGIRLTRVYHNNDIENDKRLVLAGFITKEEVEDERDQEARERAKTALREREKEAQKLLTEHLLRHPQWRQRVRAWLYDPEVDEAKRKARAKVRAFAVELGLKPVDVDRKTAQLASKRALAMLVDNSPDYPNHTSPTYRYVWACDGCIPVIIQPIPEQRPRESRTKVPPRSVLTRGTEYLDVTLFNTPKDSTSWYLRAAYHLAAGDERSARRDLRRMHEIEKDNEEARDERIATLETFQGNLRQRTNALSEQTLIEIAGGHEPPSLTEVAQLSSK